MHHGTVASMIVFTKPDDLNFFVEFATINDFEVASDFEVEDHDTAKSSTRIAPLKMSSKTSKMHSKVLRTSQITSLAQTAL